MREVAHGVVNHDHGFRTGGHAAGLTHDGVDRGGRILGLVQRSDVPEILTHRAARRQQDHRPGFGVRGGRAGQGVQQPRSGGRDDHAREPAHLRPAVRAVGRTLLVSRSDRPDPQVTQRPVELEGMRAGNPEYRVDPVAAQGLQDRAGHGALGIRRRLVT